MQQFFGLVNSLLAGCESTARRGLKMITYKVRCCMLLNGRTCHSARFAAEQSRASFLD